MIPGVARSESRLTQPVTTSSLQNDNSMRLCKLQLTTTAHHTMGPKRCMAGSTVQVCTRSSGKLSFQSPPYSNGKVRIDMKSTSNWEMLNGMQAEKPSQAMDQQYRATRQHSSIYHPTHHPPPTFGFATHWSLHHPPVSFLDALITKLVG